jgi:glutathione S-transferase
MRLYHVPGTRSTRVLWLLEEIGAPYELTVLAREDRQRDEHLLRHPLGRVPVIEEEGGFVFESAAICLHLADLHREAGLIPAPGSHERALVYQWTLFAMDELEPGLVEVSATRESDPERAATAADRFQAAGRVIEEALAGSDYLVGDRFGVADVVCGGVLAFAKRLELTQDMPGIEAYVGRLDARPARQRANVIGKT